LEAITVVGEVADIPRIAGAAARLEEQAIQTQDYTNPARVLQQVPGVYVREEDGFGNFPNISLRGVDPGRSAKLTLMEDGIMMAPAPYSSPAAYYSPRVGRMSGVEVLKGSSQVRYGPHNTGGVINYLSTPFVPLDPLMEAATLGGKDSAQVNSKNPVGGKQTAVATSAGPRSASEGYLKSSYGTENTWKNHAWWGHTMETTAGTFGYLLEFNHEHSDGFRHIDKVGGDTGYTVYEPIFKIFFEPDSDMPQRFELRLGYTNFEGNETYVGLSDRDFARDPFRRYASTQFDVMDYEQFRSSLTYTIEPSDFMRIETTAYYNYFSRAWYKLQDVRPTDGENTNPAVALGAGSGSAYDLVTGRGAGSWRIRDNNREYHAYGIQSRLDWEFATGALEHTLSVGARLHYDEENRFQRDDRAEVNGSGSVVGFSRGVPGAQSNTQDSTLALALYIEDSIKAGPFTIKPGIRWEHLWQDFENYNSGASGSGDFDVVAPGVGIVYEASDTISLFGGYHRGFSTPGPSARIADDQDVEISDGFEFGVRYYTPVVQAELVGFYSKHSDLIVPDLVGASGATDTSNAGDIEVYGLEAAFRYDPLAESGTSWRLPVRFAATLTHAELTSDTPSGDAESIFSGGVAGNEVPYIPEFNLSAGIGVEYGPFGLYVDGTYTPETYGTASNTSSLRTPSGTPDARFGEVDSALLVDVSVKYRVNEKLRLFAGVSNVLGEEYIVSRIPYGPRAGAPRMWYGGLELRF
jgi:Fe(3+) dicitrate transport protein